jgi:hypothetical protein
MFGLKVHFLLHIVDFISMTPIENVPLAKLYFVQCGLSKYI